ncbi:MAG TPA: IPT/TIG domain-containing protein [Terriglobales bacterium]|nr:IPT/TIG domain-containing protein [Terriglobales bacterium]
MHSCRDVPCKPCRVALVLVLTYLSSAWTCSAFVNFNSCQNAAPQPNISKLSPSDISVDTDSLVLTVYGRNFVPESQILWNGNSLQTTFADSHHLQATITQQTFVSFGGSDGSSVLISVVSPGSNSKWGCPQGGSSGTLVLDIH